MGRIGNLDAKMLFRARRVGQAGRKIDDGASSGRRGTAVAARALVLGGSRKIAGGVGRLREHNVHVLPGSRCKHNGQHNNDAEDQLWSGSLLHLD
jgi:hypothetical protein